MIESGKIANVKEILTNCLSTLTSDLRGSYPELKYSLFSGLAQFENANDDVEASYKYLLKAILCAEEYEKVVGGLDLKMSPTPSETYLNIANAVRYLSRLEDALVFADKAEEHAERLG